VQQTQQNYKKTAATAFVGLLAWMAISPVHAGIAVRDAPDLLLHDGGAKTRCDPRLSEPGFVPGTDVDGRPVPPADLAGARTPIPAEILVPLRNGKQRNARPGETPVIALDGKALEPILNPAPACPPGPR
jgi:hypothetical protein